MGQNFKPQDNLQPNLKIDNTPNLSENLARVLDFNMFESASGPSPIDYKNWGFIRHQNLVERPTPKFMITHWPEITELVTKLVRHSLIQRSRAYQDFRQRLPDILAFSRNLPQAMQLCRQEIRSDQNYTSSALKDKSLNQNSPNSLVDIDSKAVAKIMIEYFDQSFKTEDASKDTTEEIKSTLSPCDYNYNLFAGDELFYIPDNLSSEPISLEPWAQDNLQEIEDMVKNHTLNPNGLKVGAQELAKIFPKLRQQEEIASGKIVFPESKLPVNSSKDFNNLNASSIAQSELNKECTEEFNKDINSELDLLLSKLLMPNPDYYHIYYKGWRKAIQGETFGLFVASVSALLEIDHNGYDMAIRFKRAFMQLQLAAAYAEPYSCFLLSWLCHKFSPVLKSINVQQHNGIYQVYLQRAANLGLDIAMLDLSFRVEDKDSYTANNYLVLAARQGHPLAIREATRLPSSAMYFKGFDWGWLLLYMYRLLQPKDLSIFSPVGIMLINGQGVACDKNTAMQMFKALAPTNLDACYMLGIMYFNANGVEQDYAKAQYYFELTAPYSVFDSNALLGYLYESGDGGTLDKEKALSCYYTGLWRDTHSKQREYCAERLLHLNLKKLQEAINSQDQDREERLRSRIFRTLRLCVQEFDKDKDAWQKRLYEFSTVEKLTDLSYFNG